MKIQAAVLRGPDAPHVLETVELADPRPGEVRIRVVGAGMCHTDVIPRHLAELAPTPIITGHEGAGVVEAVGQGVTGLVPGDHVVLSYDSCRGCVNCLAGLPPYCDTFLARNLTGRDLDGSTVVTDAAGEPVAARWFGQSSFATHAIVAERNTVKVDRSLPLDLLAPLGCGVQTGAGSVLLALKVTAGSSIVIAGTGAVGLSAVMAAKVAGAATVIAIDLNDSRLELAARYGATHTINGAAPDVLERIREITGGGSQYALDTTGVPAVITTLVEGLRVTGTCGLLGVQQGDIAIGPMALTVGKTLMGIIEGSAVPQVFVPRLIALWQQGRFPFDELVTRYPLDRINEAEKASLAGEVVKPVLLPAG